MTEIPEKDLRKVYSDLYEKPEIDGYQPEFDARWLLNLGVELDPWTFDEVPLTQQIKCKIGLHRGRMEVLGGEPCFYCSYCGEIKR